MRSTSDPDNRTVDWITVVERQHPPLFISFLFHGHSRKYVRPYTGLKCSFKMMKKEDDALSVDRNEMRRCRQLLMTRLERRGPSALAEYADRCYRQGAALMETANRIARSARQLDGLSNQSMARMFEEYVGQVLGMAPFLLTFIALQAVIEESLIAASPIPSSAVVKSRLPQTLHATNVLQALHRLVDIIDLVKNDPRSSDLIKYGEPEAVLESLRATNPLVLRLMEEYAGEYGWLNTSYYAGEPLGCEDVISKVREFLCAPTTHVCGTAGRSLSHTVTRLECSHGSTALEYELAFVRSFRINVLFVANYVLREFLEDVAKRLDISYDDLLYLTYDEILKFLRNLHTESATSLVRARRRGFVVSNTSQGTQWAYCNRAVPPSSKDVRSRVLLRGRGVSRGSRRGIVKVVRSFRDSPKFMDGDILVTTMVTPDLVLMAARASAIVTDEGGLLCHAALLGRELDIPCVIGCGNATKALEDGDLVYVRNHEQAFVRRIRWKKGVRRRSPVLWRYFSTVGHSSQYFQKSLGIETGLDTCKNINHQTFLAEDEYAKLEATIRANAERDPQYFSVMAHKCYEQVEKLLSLSVKIGDTDVSRLSDVELADNFALYAEEYLRTIPYRYGILIVDEILTDLIKRAVSATLEESSQPDQVEQYLDKLVVPTKDSFEAAYSRKLLEIATLIRQDKESAGLFKGEAQVVAEHVASHRNRVTDAIGDILSEFGWISTSYYTGNPLTTEEVVRKLQELVADDPDGSLRALVEERKQARQLVTSLACSLGLPDDLKDLLAVAGAIAHLRSYRISIAYKADFNVRNLLNELAARLRIEYDDLLAMTAPEIMECLAGERTVQIKEIEQRKNDFALFLIEGSVEVYAGRRLKALQELEKEEVAPTDELKGRVAFPGRVRGPAKIVIGKKDLWKLARGDIVVSPMTTSDLTSSIVETCVGIVTDEGGTMCHAAIISRENRIPCIVGTEHATKAVNDGDVIELLAEKDQGTVRVTERAR